jgi:hypothetical protein
MLIVFISGAVIGALIGVAGCAAWAWQAMGGDE